MFTGIIEDIGTVDAVDTGADGARLRVRTTLATGDLAAIPLGASVAVVGACLTVTTHTRGAFTFDVSRESLKRTTLGALGAGARVHLERAMVLGGRLDGHLVQGHVDGVGEVVEVRRDGIGWTCIYRVPTELLGQIVLKGSIAIDGVSLTVASLEGDRVGIALVPHSAGGTLLAGMRPGQKVNIETDIIGKYVARLLGMGPKEAAPSGAKLDLAFLAAHGYGGTGHR
jgi:riboflavin synthase